MQPFFGGPAAQPNVGITGNWLQPPKTPDDVS